MPSLKIPKLATLFAGVLFVPIVSACQIQPAAEVEPDNLTNEAAAPSPLPIVEPPFTRARLLLTVVRAASSHSVGADDSDAQRLLDGKLFEVRLRFGCDGQGPGKGDHGWSLDPDGRTLRLRAVQTLSLEDQTVKAVAGEQVESAEGFWLPRPWLLNAACPESRPTEAADAAKEDQQREAPGDAGDAETVAPTPIVQRVGIVQFSTPDDSRTRRRTNRPFEAVKQLKVGESAGQAGFNLVLSGRLRAQAGRVIACSGTGRDRPPDCVVSADIDRVWIERPEDRAIMAEWTM